MAKYEHELPKKMYLYFSEYSGAGAPSFSKFARQIGVTLRTLESFKKKKKFREAYEECSEIRRDYLIDRALSRSSDASMTKYLLDQEFNIKEETDEGLEIRLSLPEGL